MSERRKAAGFTMIELMIAAAVLAVAIIGSLSALMVGAQLTARSREDSVGQQVAERRMVQLRALGYSGLKALVGTRTFTPTLSRHEQLLLLQPQTTGIDQGQQVIAMDGALIVITVRVNWFSSSARMDMSVTRETKVAEVK